MSGTEDGRADQIVGQTIVRLGGLALLPIVGYIGWPSIVEAWDVLRVGTHSWSYLLVLLIIPLLGLAVAGYLLLLSGLLIVRPSLVTLSQLGVIAGFALLWASGTVLYRIEPWIEPAYQSRFTNAVMLVSLCFSMIVTIVCFRWLARLSGLLDRDAHWWTRKNAKNLGVLLAVLWFLFASQAVWELSNWVIEEYRREVGGVMALGSLVLTVLIYKYSPGLLMALFPPVDDRKAEPESVTQAGSGSAPSVPLDRQ